MWDKSQREKECEGENASVTKHHKQDPRHIYTSES